MAERVEQRRGADPSAAIVLASAGLLTAPDAPALRDFIFSTTAGDRLAVDPLQPFEQGFGHDPDMALNRNGDGMKPAEGHRIEIHLHDRLVIGDSGVVRERHSERHDQVGLVHEPARHRSA